MNKFSTCRKAFLKYLSNHSLASLLLLALLLLTLLLLILCIRLVFGGLRGGFGGRVDGGEVDVGGEGGEGGAVLLVGQLLAVLVSGNN